MGERVKWQYFTAWKRHLHRHKPVAVGSEWGKKKKKKRGKGRGATHFAWRKVSEPGGRHCEKWNLVWGEKCDAILGTKRKMGGKIITPSASHSRREEARDISNSICTPFPPHPSLPLVSFIKRYQLTGWLESVSIGSMLCSQFAKLIFKSYPLLIKGIRRDAIFIIRSLETLGKVARDGTWNWNEKRKKSYRECLSLLEKKTEKKGFLTRYKA